MWTREDAQGWYASAYELAVLPPAMTEQMRRAHHPRGAEQRCAGPHGAVSEPWPCSTWLLAETADRIRGRG